MRLPADQAAGTAAPPDRAASDPAAPAVEDVDHPAGPAAGRRREHRFRRGSARPLTVGPLTVGVVSVVVGLLVRWWFVAGREPLTWQDTSDYLDVAGHSWLSTDLWIGERAPAAAMVLKLVGEDHGRFMIAQVLIAAVCWGLLATVTAGRLTGRWTRPVGAGAVLVFSLADALTMWDRSVLSESLALSGTALVAAALLTFLTTPTVARAAWLLAALAWWSLIRDAHGVTVLLVAGVVLLGWALGHWMTRPVVRPARILPATPVVVVVTGSLVIGGVSWLSASSADRGDFPLRNVYQVRVLPYPDRVEWFAAQGMPQAEAFLDPGRPPVHEPGEAPVLWVPEDDPAFAEWSAWLASEGRRTFMLWVLTHPSYVVREPMTTPERTFNNAEGELSFYAAADQPVVPGLGTMHVVLFPSTEVAVAAASATVILGLLRPWRAAGPAPAGRGGDTGPEPPRGCDPLWIAGAVVAVAAVPHAALAWHADGMETARHVVVPAAQVRLGYLLLAVGLLTSWWRDQKEHTPSEQWE